MLTQRNDNGRTGQYLVELGVTAGSTRADPQLVDVALARVAAGGCPPAAPTDPDVQNSRIRLFGTRIRYAGE